MKNYRILLLVVSISYLSGCNSKFSQKRIITDYVSKGYTTFEYTFSDSGRRNLKIKFSSDSTLELSNHVSKANAPIYYLWNFNVEYSYSSISIGEIQVHQMLSSNAEKFTKGNYLKPYSRSNLKSKKDIFPDISGDTILFSPDFMKIQIKEFSFTINR